MKVPKDIRELYEEAKAYEETIDRLATLPFTLNKIKKLSKTVKKLRLKAERELKFIYPELGDSNWHFNLLDGEIKKGNV